MFEELFNLPAHPLIVHAAVVLVPLKERLIRHGLSNTDKLAQINRHNQFGDRTVLFSVLVALLVVLLVVMARSAPVSGATNPGRMVLSVALTAGVVVGAVVVTYYVILTGHSGAALV